MKDISVDKAALDKDTVYTMNAMENTHTHTHEDGMFNIIDNVLGSVYTGCSPSL